METCALRLKNTAKSAQTPQEIWGMAHDLGGIYQEDGDETHDSYWFTVSAHFYPYKSRSRKQIAKCFDVERYRTEPNTVSLWGLSCSAALPMYYS